MAQIKNLKQKQDALKEINKLIKEIAQANEFLGAEAPRDSLYDISLNGTKTKLFFNNKRDIDGLVRNYKALLVNQVNNLANGNGILLDENDMNIIKY